MKTYIITGSAGFVGRHTVEYLLENTNAKIIGIDSLRHGGISQRAVDLIHSRYSIICHDLTAPFDDVTFNLIKNQCYDDITFLNLASMSHVDDSINRPTPFIENNVSLACNCLELAIKLKVNKFFQCSTDEVFGPAPKGHFHTEWEPMLPSNPYSASKVAQEAICFSYWRTYGVPLYLTRCMNMIGTHQGKEKFVPKIIGKIKRGEQVIIHGKPGNIGSRMYIDAKNLADAWLFLDQKTKPVYYQENISSKPHAFNIIGDEEIDNLKMAQAVAEIMGQKLNFKYQDFHTTRPGHDLRYALSSEKIYKLGWRPPIPIKETLKEIVDWAMQNEEWV